METGLHVDSVSGCEDCPFFADDDRNGPQCGCPRSPTVPFRKVRLRYSPRAMHVIVEKTGAKCPLLSTDVLVRRKPK